MKSKKEQRKEKLAELAEIGKQIAQFSATAPLSQSMAKGMTPSEAKKFEDLYKRRIQLEKEVREPY